MTEHPVREKLDIKILILFILRRLPETVDSETLAELALSDGGVGYFEYAECLAELEDSGHLERRGRVVHLTEKGERNGAIVESSLPWTLRSRLEKILTPLAEKLRRRSLITAEHYDGASGCTVHLSLSDEMGEIADLRLVCGGEAHAVKIEKNFRASAEELYSRIMELLLEEKTDKNRDT